MYEGIVFQFDYEDEGVAIRCYSIGIFYVLALLAMLGMLYCWFVILGYGTDAGAPMPTTPMYGMETIHNMIEHGE